MKEKIKKIKSAYTKAFASQFGTIFSDWLSLVVLGLIIFLLSFIAGWVPDGLTAYFIEGDKEKGQKMLGWALLALVFILLSARFLLFSLKFRAFEKEPSKRKALILFLSVPFLGKGESFEDKRQELLSRLNGVQGIEEKLETINNSFVRSWRMTYEAVKYHLPRLERVVVITSPQSSPYFAFWREILGELPFDRELKVSQLNVEPSKKPENAFEDFEAIQKVVEEAYSVLEGEGYGEKEVILDITGGQKIVSIVGALLSLYGRREFQYVSTNDYSVKSYDVEVVKVD